MNLVLCNKPIHRIGFAKKMQYWCWEAPKINIGISILTTISANIGLKWYYRVQVMGYFVDFVPYKHLANSKLSNKYLKSFKLWKQIYRKYPFQIGNIVSVSKNQYRPALPESTIHGTWQMKCIKIFVTIMWTDLSACHSSDGPSKSRLIGHQLDTNWQGTLNHQ